MACNTIQFSAHGFIKLTVRKIDAEDVIEVARSGIVIFEYSKDKPYPSRLVLGWVNSGGSKKALHVVVAEDTINNKSHIGQMKKCGKLISKQKINKTSIWNVLFVRTEQQEKEAIHSLLKWMGILLLSGTYLGRYVKIAGIFTSTRMRQ